MPNAVKTPRRQKNQNHAEENKMSGKKLVQARLPFKIISSSPSAAESVEKVQNQEKESTEIRKRKLSADTPGKNEASGMQQASKRRSMRKDKVETNNNKKKNDTTTTEQLPLEVVEVVLSDSDEDNHSRSKENLQTVKKQKPTQSDKTETQSNNDDCDDVELMETSDDDDKTLDKQDNASKITIFSNPMPSSKNIDKPVTPHSGNKSSVKGRKSVSDSAGEPKVQIKLPFNKNKKNRRRKVAHEAMAANVEQEQPDDMSDENELPGHKRPKLEETVDLTSPLKKQHPSKSEVDVEKTTKILTVEKPKSAVVEIEKTIEVLREEVPALAEVQKEETVEALKEPKPEKAVQQKDEEKVESLLKEVNQVIEIDQSSKGADTDSVGESKEPESEKNELDDGVSENDVNKSKHELSSSTTDVEADGETETTIQSDNKHKSVIPETAKSTAMAANNNQPVTPKSSEVSASKMQKKNLTPKQQKLLEQRLKAREEKERKIQEERLQKQREKEERELAKKREREEKEEQRRKERDEKEEQRRKEREEKDELKRKERDEKERKRLAELEAKNEEKRKRNEAKEEELRKKEEDRKRKEQEKEEAEIKKKKAALAFSKFFARPTHESNGQSAKEHGKETDCGTQLAFRPFQIKADMKLAPIVRKKLSENERVHLDAFFGESNLCKTKKQLYLSQLKDGAIKPSKWQAPVQSDITEAKSDDDDVIVIEDDLERAGQAIVEEPHGPVEHLRVKFYKFHENRRPPYYGTWRKKSSVITSRRPLAQDKKYFDYEIDSDDEWEEEEPGESLDGSDDDKEKESEDEDYEVDNEWFVPHGHLSDEELQNEDDLGENNDREAQQAKLQVLQQEFAQEMKKKTEKIKPRLIGCIWVDENGNQPELCPKIIWDTLNMRAILCAEPPIVEETDTPADRSAETNSNNGQQNEKPNGETKLKPITLNEAMLKQLVHLVHGNTHSKSFLIKEFIAYIELNEDSVRNGDARGPLKSAVREKIDEYAQWQVVEETNNIDSSKDNSNSAKKKKNKKKLCWVVSDETLQKMDMMTLDLQNEWQYTLEPRAKRKGFQKTDGSVSTTAIGEDSNEQTAGSVEQSSSVTNSPSTSHIKSKSGIDIKKFTKVLTAEEKAQQIKTATNINIKETPTPTVKPNAKPTTPTVKKRVPLLMSVARGQSISTPDKNARISQYLKNINNVKNEGKSEDITKTAETPMDTDDTIVLD